MITNQENEILDLLAQVYNKFVALPPSHQQEQQEFTHSIHALQNMVWARVGGRSTLPHSPAETTGPYELQAGGKVYLFNDLKSLNKFAGTLHGFTDLDGSSESEFSLANDEYFVDTQVYRCEKEDELDDLIWKNIAPELRHRAWNIGCGLGKNCQIDTLSEGDNQVLIYCNFRDPASGKPLFNFNDKGELVPPIRAPFLAARVILAYKEKPHESL